MDRPALPVLVVGAHTLDLRGVRTAIAELGLRSTTTPAIAPDLQAAITAFRYRYDLISAEDCHRWLAARGLLYADLSASLQRQRAGVVAASAFEQDIDLLLGAAWPELASAVATRLAVAAESTPVLTPPFDWKQLDRDFLVWASDRRDLAARTRLLTQTHLHWLRAVVHLAEFDSAESAWEAHWCVLQDGEPLPAIAARAALAHRSGTEYLQDLPPSVARALVQLAPGSTSEPIADGARWLLISLERVIEPALSEPRIAEGIDRQLDAIAIEQLLARQVRWLI